MALPSPGFIVDTCCVEMEKYYHQHKIPATVYLLFIRMFRSVCDDIPPNTMRNITPSVQQAMEQQMRLPSEFLPRGYLATGWHDSLIQDNNPNEMVKHLLLGLWRILFAQVRELRNTHNNRTESIVDVYEQNQLLAELREWKRIGPERLGAGSPPGIPGRIRPHRHETTTDF